MRAHRFLIAVAVTLAVAGCGDSDTDSTSATSAPPSTTADTGADAGELGDATVSVVGFAFAPSTITVAAGSTVTWVNEDDALHTVTPSGGDPTAFGGGLDGVGASVAVTFDEPGTYEYLCSVHPGMTGSVTVS